MPSIVNKSQALSELRLTRGQVPRDSSSMHFVRCIVLLAFISAVNVSAARDASYHNKQTSKQQLQAEHTEQEFSAAAMFASMMSSKPSGWSVEYEQAHDVRIKELSWQNCDLYGAVLASAIYAETPVDCLHKSRYDRIPSFVADPMGKCAWRLDFFVSPFLDLNVTSFPFNFLYTITEVTRVGSFSLQCHLDQEADECGLGIGDDGIILEAQGPLYAVPNVAIPGTGPVPLLEGATECYNRCVDIFVNQTARILDYFAGALGVRSSSDMRKAFGNTGPDIPNTELGDHLKFPGTQHPDGAKTQHSREGIGTPTYTRGAAVIASGPVRLMGKHTNLKMDEGYLQAVKFAYAEEGSPAIVPTDNTIIAEPYTLHLRLKKREQY